MKTILDEIVAAKKLETERRRRRRPLASVEARPVPGPRPSFRDALQAPGVRIIAEIKYRSPSHGTFRCQAPAVEVAEAYARAGAAALSVLTDEPFFGGRPEFLEQIACRQLESGARALPLLRKDFLLDPWQIAESAALGASACLLIVACLRPSELRSLIACAGDRGLEPLVEVHDEAELEVALAAGARTIGVNNRNLKTFETSTEVSFRLARQLEGDGDVVLVTESGLSEPSQLLELQDAGFDAFLIGGSLMDTADPGAALGRLLEAVEGAKAT